MLLDIMLDVLTGKILRQICTYNQFCDPVSFDKSTEYVPTLPINGALHVACHKYSFSVTKDEVFMLLHRLESKWIREY